MNRRTRNTIPSHLTEPIALITDLEDVIKQCIVPDVERPTIRICSYDGGLIRNEDNKSVYITEWQKGYLEALLRLPEVNLQVNISP